MRIRRIGVIANCSKPQAAELLGRLARKAGALGLGLAAPRETARLLRGGGRVETLRLPGRIDCLVVLGGDGTLLRAVRALDGARKPVLGVNIGGLGFLTSVAPEDLERALECLASGRYFTSERAVAECRLRRRGAVIGRYRALNDVVMTRGESGRIVTLDMRIGREHVASYVCDGLIVATPTGSTGHSLSANGPILSPGTPAFVVSPICPHALSCRPLVVPDTSRLSVAVAETAGDMLLSVDGQVGQRLIERDAVDVWRSAGPARFIHLPGYSYFSVLRHKLDWRGSNW